jgi:hypothetical protein
MITKFIYNGGEMGFGGECWIRRLSHEKRSIAAVAQAANNGSDLGLSSTSLSFFKKMGSRFRFG